MDFEKLLRQHTLKVTPQRLGILTLMHTYGHISIEDLYVQIKLVFKSISLATLYKNVHAMMQNDLITEVKIPGVKSRYEIAKESHGHFLCQECGEFIDLQMNLDNAITSLQTPPDYLIEESHVVLTGLCPSCQKKQ